MSTKSQPQTQASAPHPQNIFKRVSHTAAFIKTPHSIEGSKVSDHTFISFSILNHSVCVSRSSSSFRRRKTKRLRLCVRGWESWNSRAFMDWWTLVWRGGKTKTYFDLTVDTWGPSSNCFTVVFILKHISLRICSKYFSVTFCCVLNFCVHVYCLSTIIN